ncbi:MAG: hypothetical protein U1A07_05135 [Phenylobacterium sp.]|nr:hypothetical protein [Phenylobacterium sp.]
MTSPIDPIRRSALVRRAQRSAGAGGKSLDQPEDRSLPVTQDSALPAVEPPVDPSAAFNAHLLGQDGQKRGLRGGPATLGAAKATYNKVEWSGPADRRARKGGAAKTEV